MENEWEKEKEKILNSLLGAGQESIDFTAEAEVLFCFNIIQAQITKVTIKCFWIWFTFFFFWKKTYTNLLTNYFSFTPSVQAKVNENSH